MSEETFNTVAVISSFVFLGRSSFDTLFSFRTCICQFTKCVVDKLKVPIHIMEGKRHFSCIDKQDMSKKI